MILLALLLAAAPRVVYVKAGRLFDGLSESYKQNVALKIENDRIAATNVSIPPGAPVIDLSNATVLPGLIDCHLHLESRADHFEDIWTFKTSPLAPAMTAVVHARRTLEAGFAAVRESGFEPVLPAALRYLIDDEGIRLMKERGTFLVGDVYNDDYILAHAEDLRIPREYVDKERAIGQIQRDNWAKAVRAGVRVAFGTDAGIYPHGDNAKQFAWMVRLGLSPARAILAATAWAAELLDRQKDVGTVQAGRYADLIAVPGDPLKDVRVLERVPFVMKGGAVIKDDLSATSAGPASSSSSR